MPGDAGGYKLSIQIDALPSDNGAPITAVQYETHGSGTWVDLPTLTGAQTVDVVPQTDGGGSPLPMDVRIRAVNTLGASVESSIATIVPTLGP